MTNYQINGGAFNAQPWNGAASQLTIAGTVRVLYIATAITLDWSPVVGANYYQIQVSLFPDFRSTFVDQSSTETDYSFTDSQTNDQKRYWRWRPSVAAGAGWLEPWSEVGSYWLDTGAAAEIDVPKHYWTMFDPDDVTDIYWLDLIPAYTIVKENIYRYRDRNRLGELLSEFLTVKGTIRLSFMAGQYIAHAQFNEICRFNNAKRTLFLATYKIGERDRPMPHIWKVEFSEEPTFTMIAPGRPDLLRGNVSFTEV